MTEALKQHSIPLLPAQAALFVWLDLRAWLKSNSWEGEFELWQKILNEGRVNITRGEACAAEEPGWFRMCCAHVDDCTLHVAIDRLAKALES